MKAETSEIADRTQRAPLVIRHDSMGRVLDNPETMASRDGEHGIHFAGNPGIVHGDQRARARGDGGLDQTLIEIERVLADVDKDRHSATQHEGIRRRYERVGRQDDLVAGLDIEQQRGHLQRRGAGVGEQRPGAAGLLFNPPTATLRERSVAGQMMVALGFGHVTGLLAGGVWPIERDGFDRHVFWPSLLLDR